MTDTTPKAPLHAVLYADGGFQPSFASGGWGLHGYTYTQAPPTKGTGNPKALPTGQGYAASKGDGDPVTVASYVDGIGGVHKATSSTHTELTAIIQALQWVVEKGVAHCTIYNDNENVVKGASGWIDTWKSNNWMTSRGVEVANKDLWLTADDLIRKAREANQLVEFKWIRSHCGLFGNEMADSYAKRGNILGRRRIDLTVLMETQADGYWSRKADYDRLLGASRWYFASHDAEYRTADGRTIYYLGDVYDDDQTGKPDSDTAQVVVYLREADTVLEQLRTAGMAQTLRPCGALMIGRLNHILTPAVYHELKTHGTLFLEWDRHRLDALTVEKKPVIEEIAPPGRAHDAVENFNGLQRLLDRYETSDVGVIRTDVLELFYDVEVKKDVKRYKLKKDYTSTTRSMDVQVRYSTAKCSELTGPDDPSIRTQKVRMIFGQDLPKRNTLAAVADGIVSMEVIAWRESDQAFRFATVVTTTTGVAVFSGVDANLFILT